MSRQEEPATEGACPVDDGCFERMLAEREARVPAALDVKRLARAMRVSLDIYGWDLDEMADQISAEYARLSNQPSTEPAR